MEKSTNQTENKSREYYRNRQKGRLELSILAAMNEADKNRINDYEPWKPYLSGIKQALESALHTLREHLK